MYEIYDLAGEKTHNAIKIYKHSSLISILKAVEWKNERASRDT